MDRLELENANLKQQLRAALRAAEVRGTVYALRLSGVTRASGMVCSLQDANLALQDLETAATGAAEDADREIDALSGKLTYVGRVVT